MDDEDRDYDERVQTAVVDVVSEISKLVTNGFATFGQKMLKFLAETRSTGERSLFIGCFADCLKACPNMVPQLADSILPCAVANLSDEDTNLYRNTVFCVGILYEFAGPQLAPKALEVLQYLWKVIATPEIDPATIDNAISAVGRMIIGSPAGFPYESVLPSWFANLPLKSDYEEAATILKTLLVMVNA